MRGRRVEMSKGEGVRKCEEMRKGEGMKKR